MVIKTIKKASSLTGIVISIVIVLAFVYGMFGYWIWNVNDSGVAFDSEYNYTYTNITASTAALDNNINTMRDDFQNIKEADNAFQVAWNGLKGLGRALATPIFVVGAAINLFSAILFPFAFIPTWVKTLSTIGLTAVIVFLLFAILKGEPKM